MDQVKFVEDRDTVCLIRPCPFEFFKGCLPQILLRPFLNNLSHIYIRKDKIEDFREIFPTITKPIKGTRKIHEVITKPGVQNGIYTRNFSCA